MVATKYSQQGKTDHGTENSHVESHWNPVEAKKPQMNREKEMAQSKRGHGNERTENCGQSNNFIQEITDYSFWSMKLARIKYIRSQSGF